jgi:hypothetical protein
MINGQIGQPAASMIDHTLRMLLDRLPGCDCRIQGPATLKCSLARLR